MYIWFMHVHCTFLIYNKVLSIIHDIDDDRRESHDYRQYSICELLIKLIRLNKFADFFQFSPFRE